MGLMQSVRRLGEGELGASASHNDDENTSILYTCGKEIKNTEKCLLKHHIVDDDAVFSVDDDYDDFDVNAYAYVCIYLKDEVWDKTDQPCQTLVYDLEHLGDDDVLEEIESFVADLEPCYSEIFSLTTCSLSV